MRKVLWFIILCWGAQSFGEVPQDFFLHNLDERQSKELYLQFKNIISRRLDKIFVTSPWVDGLDRNAIQNAEEELANRVQKVQNEGPYAGFIYPTDYSYQIVEVCLSTKSVNKITITDIHDESHRYKLKEQRHSYDYFINEQYKSVDRVSQQSNDSYEDSMGALAYVSTGNAQALASAYIKSRGKRQDNLAIYLEKQWKLYNTESERDYYFMKDDAHQYYDRHEVQIIPVQYCSEHRPMVRGEVSLQILPEAVRKARNLELTLTELANLISEIEKLKSDFVSMASHLNREHILSFPDPNYEDPYGNFWPAGMKKKPGFGQWIQTGSASLETYFEQLAPQASRFHTLISGTYQQLISRLEELKIQWYDLHPIAQETLYSTMKRLQTYSQRPQKIIYRFALPPSLLAKLKSQGQDNRFTIDLSFDDPFAVIELKDNRRRSNAFSETK